MGRWLLEEWRREGGREGRRRSTRVAVLGAACRRVGWQDRGPGSEDGRDPCRLCASLPSRSLRACRGGACECV